jgi:hypothetical protein
VLTVLVDADLLFLLDGFQTDENLGSADELESPTKTDFGVL